MLAIEQLKPNPENSRYDDEELDGLASGGT
jgi:hypothetical protein